MDVVDCVWIKKARNGHHRLPKGVRLTDTPSRTGWALPQHLLMVKFPARSQGRMPPQGHRSRHFRERRWRLSADKVPKLRKCRQVARIASSQSSFSNSLVDWIRSQHANRSLKGCHPNGAAATSRLYLVARMG